VTVPRGDRTITPAFPVGAQSRERAVDGVSLLTVYLVLLFAIPSNITIAALGSLGRPSLIWGIVLIVFWGVARLQQRTPDLRAPFPSVTFAFALFLVIALIGFAAALLRGEPDAQVSPAFTGIIRLLSWAGVVLVTVDGVRSADDVARMIRRLVVACGLMAALGIAQFLTGQTLLDFFNLIPGLSNTGGGVVERSGVTRSSGTATHPLEYATTLIGVLPLAIVGAMFGGYRASQRPSRFLWWLPVVLIAVSALVAVSRSAVVGFVLAAVLTIPAIPRRYRVFVIVGGALVGGAVIAAIPGLLGTTLGLFAGAGTDPSTQSRVGGITKAPQFIGASPVIGVGWGTFLPDYYIFDNQWILTTIEMGILGVAAFAWLMLSGIWAALAARRRAALPEVSRFGYPLAVAVVVNGVMFAFFDGLSFPISAGALFLILGLCGSLLRIASARSATRDDPTFVSPLGR
jgi:O-antigen ligase